jgi:hypothetical protein
MHSLEDVRCPFGDNPAYNEDTRTLDSGSQTRGELDKPTYVEISQNRVEGGCRRWDASFGPDELDG